MKSVLKFLFALLLILRGRETAQWLCPKVMPWWLVAGPYPELHERPVTATRMLQVRQNLLNIETTIVQFPSWYNNAHIWLAYLPFHCIYVIYLSERAYFILFTLFIKLIVLYFDIFGLTQVFYSYVENHLIFNNYIGFKKLIY